MFDTPHHATPHHTTDPTQPTFLNNSALAATATAELSPVCAVMGGILGQEILKAVSRKGEPALNCFLWDGGSHEGRVVRLPPVAAPGQQQ